MPQEMYKFPCTYDTWCGEHVKPHDRQSCYVSLGTATQIHSPLC